jgi:hypothetical protein
MSTASDAFDGWIRGRFVALNTALEDLYFAQTDRANVEGVGDDLKAMLRDEGHVHVAALQAEGNTGDGFESAFDVLGNVGMYLAAMRRHELTNPAREDRSPFREASSLALHAGASIGMAPRFASAHLATHNRAIAGVRKSFTSLADEFLFIDDNTRAMLAFQRAAEALVAVLPLGVGNPVADGQFIAAAAALRDVIACNTRLFAELDIDRFFFCVRPYYKPYRVGRQEYRGANAGDFSGINELDLLLGLCRANDPSYAQLLVDKMLFMLPGDQARLREAMRHRSLLDAFLLEIATGRASPVLARNIALFLDVVAIFGQTATQHHDQLVERFIAKPSAGLANVHLAQVTASGPPLPVLMASLAQLRDQRTAADRPGIGSRHADLARLSAAIDR